MKALRTGQKILLNFVAPFPPDTPFRHTVPLGQDFPLFLEIKKASTWEAKFYAFRISLSLNFSYVSLTSILVPSTIKIMVLSHLSWGSAIRCSIMRVMCSTLMVWNLLLSSTTSIYMSYSHKFFM